MSDNFIQNSAEISQQDINRKRKSKETKSSANKKQKSQYQRKNIKKIITEKDLNESTIKALQDEQERQKRLQENQVSLNSVDDESDSDTIYLNDSLIDLDGICDNNDDNDDDDDDELVSSDSNDDIMLLDSNNKNPASFIRNPINEVNDDDDDDCQIISDHEAEAKTSSTTVRGVHTNDKLNVPDSKGRVLINVNHSQDEPDVYLVDHLAKNIKTHQIGGIRFLFDNIIESITRVNDSNSTGFGCILAHSMGLGKTFQIVTFTDICFRYTPFKRVLCIVPINTIQNWYAEYNRWLPRDDTSNTNYKRLFQVFIINDNQKTFSQRASVVLQWEKEGGVLLIGYEMYRTLVSNTKEPIRRKGNSSKKHQLVDLENEDKNVLLREEVKEILLKPCLVICDEGHRIKNSSANTAKALQSIKTKRRIVLTGYPLQNNLIEYWCMVNFVRPSYLGTKSEFSNMFEKPIMNGQCVDSTFEDIKLMKYRSHVLHSLLEGFVQRRSHEVFLDALPKKEEFVILTKLTSTQKDLYLSFMRSIGAMIVGEKINPLRAFAICCKIWNHPDVLFKYVSNKEPDIDLDLPELNSQLNVTDKKSNNNNNDYEWAIKLLENYTERVLENGTKFSLAFSLIDQCIQIGDKVLLFSQSLLSLNLIEEFLKEKYVPGKNEKWEKNKNYYRLDGSTNGIEREKLINSFNDPNGTAWLFLLSTRAGCLGINLIGANRVIMLDASFNPCHDAQAVCRVYRYGQKKNCFIYRLIADHTMEKKIYDRQISKQNMSDRVIDEIQTQNHFTRTEVEKLIHYVDEDTPNADLNDIYLKYNDLVLINACLSNQLNITKEPFKHESLLLDKREYQLSNREKRYALQHFENEKKYCFNYGRSSYAAYYPKELPKSNTSYYSSSISYQFNDQSSNDIIYQSTYKPNSHISLASSSSPSSSSCSSSTIQYNHNDYSRNNNNTNLSNLNSKGISIHSFITKRAFTIPFMEQKQVIQAGIRVILLNTPKGWYMRTPEGKLFAIKNPQAFINELSNQYDNENKHDQHNDFLKTSEQSNFMNQDFIIDNNTSVSSSFVSSSFNSPQVNQYDSQMSLDYHNQINSPQIDQYDSQMSLDYPNQINSPQMNINLSNSGPIIHNQSFNNNAQYKYQENQLNTSQSNTDINNQNQQNTNENTSDDPFMYCNFSGLADMQG